MAKSFWSRRKETMNTAGGYMKATDTVSRPTALLMTILGIIVVGGLFFAVFWGARWTFEQLANNDTDSSQTSGTGSTANETAGSSEENPAAGSATESPSVTVTTSTSTTTPSTPQPVVAAPTTVPAASNNLPRTGPGSTTAFFFAVLIVSYLAYRRKLTRE